MTKELGLVLTGREQWLAEGMAEWVAFSTLERLGLDTVGRRRERATSGILDQCELFGAGLDLQTHGTPQGFASWHVREGTLPTYQLAFLMADYLPSRVGVDFPPDSVFTQTIIPARRRAGGRLFAE